MIPKTGKSFYLYNKIIVDIKNIVLDSGIKIRDIPKNLFSLLHTTVK